MYSIGMDIGYSSVKLTMINSRNEIVCNKYKLHKGYVKEVIKELIEAVCREFSVEKIVCGAVTGSGGRLFENNGSIAAVNGITAAVEGSEYLNKNAKSIIDIGGQNAKYITDFNQEDKSRIKISMNSNCAAGTGSFLEEQVRRLNLKLEDYSIHACRAVSIPRIAGRCSVFAKTDIIHHQQDGVPVDDILLGLAYAVIKNYKGAVIKRLPILKPVLFTGGVAHNQGIITALKDVLKLNDDELLIPEYFSNAGAIGAAVIAAKEKYKIDIQAVLNRLEQINEHIEKEHFNSKLPVLKLYGKNDNLNKHTVTVKKTSDGIQKCCLGIDIGSTSTNLVITDTDDKIIAYKYLPTLGEPLKAVQKGFKELEEEFNNCIRISGVGITGSGRYMVGRLVGTDIIKDEITAQAAAAVKIDRNVDTIFEIGGQDSKFISIKDGAVRDFQMNKICAAGTGSFIEEQSKKFDIPINKFAGHALNSNSAVDLGERCTVFIETGIAAHIAAGSKTDDIAAGLCYSIVKNYMNRVVGKKKIGRKIFLQGGIAHNQGIINAFRAVTGREIHVPPFFSVTGAYGAAIMAGEAMSGKETAFKGFNFEYDGDAGKENIIEKVNNNFNERLKKNIFAGYDGFIDPGKKTIGIPRALFAFGMFPMFNAFFKELGFNILLSSPTSEKTIQAGQEYSLDETCYPVKLINGHVAELVNKKVDFIFFPDLFTVDHSASKTRKNYGCVYMQLAFKMIKQAMQLDEKGITLLCPTLSFNFGQEFMMKSFIELGEKLERDREEIFNALRKAMKASEEFRNTLEEKGKLIASEIKPDEKVFVIISKIYGVVDPVLNMGIPDRLMKMGYKVISFSDLMENDIFDEHPNMYWAFTQHILGAAQIVKKHPNFYAVFLTHHGCGPDSVTAHYFREIMGDKPYLNIEVDEHSSDIGVITRLEAFINSLEKEKTKEADNIWKYFEKKPIKKVNIKTSFKDVKKDKTVYLQNLYPYSDICGDILRHNGINSCVLPETDSMSVNIGRKYTITNEYLSLTALLGDTFKKLSNDKTDNRNTAFFVFQNEGTETDGQYSRLLRAKLDEEGFENVEVISPYVEDIIYMEKEYFETVCLALLAGDIVRLAPKNFRDIYLRTIKDLIKEDNFSLKTLKKIAENVFNKNEAENYEKKIFALGEPLLLFNNFLNNKTFERIEEKGHKVIYSPLSEYLWLMLSDFVYQNRMENNSEIQEKLEIFKKYISGISGCFQKNSLFEKSPEDLISPADKSMGLYAGANGRYREAKALSELKTCKGIITVSSMYENTGIILNIVHREFEKNASKPVLNLTFDGNRNENDESKVDSFIYYL